MDWLLLINYKINEYINAKVYFWTSYKIYCEIYRK